MWHCGVLSCKIWKEKLENHSMQQLFRIPFFWWDNLTLPQALLVGVACGIATSLIPYFVFGADGYWWGFVCLFPFFMALTLKALWAGWTSGVGFMFGYFSQFFATRFGLFCVGWHFTIMPILTISEISP